jgi:hypothetical protein
MSEFMSALVLEPAEPSNPSSRRFFLIAALFLLTIGTGLRIYHLGVRSLWLDEALTANISRGTWYDGAFTGHFSRGSLKEVLEQTRMWGSYPVTYPWILYLVEKVGEGPAAVRAVSVLASILAVLMMLAMVRVNVSSSAALFSAAILAVSTTQIRYAQEVREYSLSVLFASILIFYFLQWESAGSQNAHPVLLYAALFLAPLIQYGLVLFALGILATIGLLLLLSRSTRFRLSHAVIASASLGAGGLLSLFLTLRYQLAVRQFQGYLAANYFDSKTTSLLSFLAGNSYGLLRFLLPGRVVGLCFVIGAIIFCVGQVRRRKCDPVAILTFTSVLITIGASLARAYPYGGIRQCLFLAPVLALFAGVAFADLLEGFRGPHRQAAVLGVMALIFLSGGRGILKSSPYGEVEDIRSVLKELEQSSAPNDQVYVHPGASPAVDFYVQGKDRRFVYGKDHYYHPQEYVPELLASIDRHTDRIWLLFAHSHGPEEKGIVDSLRSGWNVQRVFAASGATLYVAHRGSSPVLASVQP